MRVQARHLLQWKHQQQPRGAVELTDEDRQTIEHARRARAVDILHKACFPLLRTISGHKVRMHACMAWRSLHARGGDATPHTLVRWCMQWSFPFLAPVDTTKYVDYLTVVKNPMDLGTIKTRVEMGFYKDPKASWARRATVHSQLGVLGWQTQDAATCRPPPCGHQR